VSSVICKYLNIFIVVGVSSYDKRILIPVLKLLHNLSLHDDEYVKACGCIVEIPVSSDNNEEACSFTYKKCSLM